MFFGQNVSVEITVGTSSTNANMPEIVVGMKQADVASVPTVTPKDVPLGPNEPRHIAAFGNEKQGTQGKLEGLEDALSTFGSFSNETTINSVRLGVFFATGMAAQNLSQGFRCATSGNAAEGCASRTKPAAGAITDDQNTTNRTHAPNTTDRAHPRTSRTRRIERNFEIEVADEEIDAVETTAVEPVDDPLRVVPIPSTLNPGLSSAKSATMKQILGVPRDNLDQECRPVVNEPLRSLIVTASVGPFNVTGLKPPVQSLRRVLSKVKRAEPTVHDMLSSAGILCARLRSGTGISNHA